MSKNLVAGLIFAASFLLVANVSADTIEYTYKLNTFDSSQWLVTAIPVEGYINPGRTGNGTASNPYKYDGTGTKWGTFGTPDWAELTWQPAAQGSRDTWKAPATNWIAAVNNVDAGSNNENKVLNGFYAFKYTFFAKDPEDTSVSGTLNLTLGADDYIAAIYANGELIYVPKSSELAKGSIISDLYWTDMFSLDFANVNLTDGFLDLIFVVHNTNMASSTNPYTNTNPMGLYVDGSLITNVEMTSRMLLRSSNPEPATLAILGLGLAGVGLAARRRNKK